MQPRTPLLVVTAIAILIHLTALIAHYKWGLRTALNLTPPAAGSLLAIYLVRKGKPPHQP
ncbi:hypothetical protein GA0115233_11861 [Streptomyces sp. DI166]|nr:hypothetical protein GA0115233_11861 [Streptomyces sp. DI166]